MPFTYANPRDRLIDQIMSGGLMDRDDQEGEFNRYQSYNERDKMPANIHIFFSYYQYEDYSGYGFLYGYDSDTNTFFRNSGSHCSCYGLEDQWGPEEYTFEQMVACLRREIANYDGDSYYESDKEMNMARVELLKLILGEE